MKRFIEKIEENTKKYKIKNKKIKKNKNLKIKKNSEKLKNEKEMQALFKYKDSLNPVKCRKLF